jgi:hypothetical protein
VLREIGRQLPKIGKRDYRRLHLEKLAIADSLDAASRGDTAPLLRNCCTSLIIDVFERASG